MFSSLFGRNGVNTPGTSVQMVVKVSVVGRNFKYDSRRLFRGYRFSLLIHGTLNLFSLDSIMPSVSACCLLEEHVYRCRGQRNMGLVRGDFRRLANSRLSHFGVSNGSIHVSDGLVNDGVT